MIISKKIIHFMKYLGLILFVLSNIAIAEEIFFCSDSHANGFKKKQGHYSPTTFNPKRFDIKLLDNGHIVINSPSMDSAGLYNCVKPVRFTPNTLNYDIATGWKSCASSNGYLFNFNSSNGHYVFAKGYGYVFSDHDGDSVAIRIGVCSKS